MFKIKDGYKLELKPPKTMKLLDSTKNLVDLTSPEVVEVVLVQCNIVDDQYQQKSEVLCMLIW